MSQEPQEQSSSIHVPVLVREVLEALDPQPGQTIVDGTFGGGGHARQLLQRVGSAGRLIGLDRDPAVIAAAEKWFAAPNVTLVHSNYSDLAEVLASLEIERVDGILLDLGLSSDQLADDDRGFSYEADGPLDMRFDPDRGKPAWELVQYLPEKELANLIYEFGEERFSRRIARKIVAVRREEPIRTADQLARIVRSCVPRSRGHRIDPATRTFQALRIAVNRELESLERALATFPDLLQPGGRMAVISFHSLEDRMVKHGFRENPRWEPLFRKPIQADATEAAKNPRARSAKLRVAKVTRDEGRGTSNE